MTSYSDVQRAVRAEKRKIFGAWLAGNLIALLVSSAIGNLAGMPTIGQLLFAVVFVALTVTAFRMTRPLNRRLERERRAMLGDDYPG
jgi:quinol-cytochrome oxidoreductase complex cytochrome b subunit